MENINFQPLFDYIDKAIDKVKEDLIEKLASKEDLRRLQRTIDSFAKNYKHYGENLKVVENKAQRVETWVISASGKIQVPYNP